MIPNFFFRPRVYNNTLRSMPDKQILVVRGHYRGVDPNFACAAHTAEPGKYGIVTVVDGKVSSRVVTSRAWEAQEAIDSAFRGEGSVTVFADQRDSDGLLPPLDLPDGTQTLDLPDLRRYLNPEEIFSCRNNTAFTRQLLDEKNVSDASFRGAAQEAGYKAGFDVRQTAHFKEYRGGLQDSLSRSTFLTRVEAKTDEFRGLLERTERGLDAVEARLMGRGQTPPSMAELNATFRGHLQPGDQLFSDVMHQSGYVAVDREARYQAAPGPDEHGVIGAIVGLPGMTEDEAAAVYRGSAPPAPSVAVQEITQEYRASREQIMRQNEGLQGVFQTLSDAEQHLIADIMS